jgi:hypothetical protein
MGGQEIEQRRREQLIGLTIACFYKRFLAFLRLNCPERNGHVRHQDRIGSSSATEWIRASP